MRIESPKPLVDAADSWLTPARFALILAGLILFFFPDVILEGKAFVFRDFGIFTYPVASFQRESFWKGQLPLWNPLNNCGIPFLAQWNTVVLYPLSLIYLLLPLSSGLSCYFLTHIFLAGFGMYLLAANWTGNRLAAAVAGITFAFNGMTLNCLMWASNLAALAWMPWVILLVERTWKSGGQRRFILAAFIGAVQMFTGAPEIIILTWLILMALWLGHLMAAETQRIRSVRLLLIIPLIGLLSAAQLLPFLDLLAHSERNAALGASFWTIPASGWANLFEPLYRCYRSPLGVYFQPWQDWSSSYYLGIGTLTLAFLAVALVRTPRVWLLTGIALFGFIAALGNQGGLYTILLKLFPPLGFMRYPIKFSFLTVFAVPLLAAFGVGWFRTAGKIQPKTVWRWTAGAFVVVILITGGILGDAYIHPYPREQWSLVLQNGLWRAIFLSMILGLLLVGEYLSDSRRKIIAGLLIQLLVWLDLTSATPRQNPTVDASVYQPGLLTQHMNPPPKVGEARAFMTRQSHDFIFTSMLPDAYADYLGRRCALLGDCNLLDDIPTPDGFYSLYVREQRSLFLQFFNSPTNHFPSGLADFLGVAYMSDPGKLLEWQSRPSHLPLCCLGPQPVFTPLENIPALLLSRAFDPRRVVYLTPEVKNLINITNQAQGKVLEAQITAQRLDFEVEASAPTLLVLSQTYYHLWHAYVDEKPVPLWRANLAFQALEVPAGNHHVKLIYRDPYFDTGAALSLLALGACGLIWWRAPKSH